MSNQVVSVLKSWLSRGRFALSLVAFLSTVYVTIGASLFPVWWHVLFWGNSEWRKEAWSDVGRTIEYFPLGIAVMLLLVLSMALASRFYWRFIKPIFLEHWLQITLVSMTMIAIVPLLTYRFYHADFEAFSESYSQYKLMSTQYGHRLPPPPKGYQIEPPLYFYFLDSAEIDRVFSQLAPDFLEVSRIRSAHLNGKGEVRLQAGAVEGQFGGESGGSTVRSFERPEWSSQRKAIELINHCLRENCLTYVKAKPRLIASAKIRVFLMRVNLQRLIEGHSRLLPNAREYRAGWQEQLRWHEVLWGQVDDFDDLEGKETLISSFLRTGFSALTGFVFLEGGLDVSSPSSSPVILTRRFLERAEQPITVRVEVPSTLETPLDPGKVEVRVFGIVKKRLDSQDTITIRALALIGKSLTPLEAVERDADEAMERLHKRRKDREKNGSIP